MVGGQPLCPLFAFFEKVVLIYVTLTISGIGFCKNRQKRAQPLLTLSPLFAFSRKVVLVYMFQRYFWGYKGLKTEERGVRPPCYQGVYLS